MNPEPAPPDIRDIVPPPELPDVLQIVLMVAWVCFALIAVGGLGFLLLRRMRRQQAPATPTPQPRELALAELDRVREGLDELTPNELGVRVSNVIKEFVHRLYRDPLLFETSEEFLRRLETNATGIIPEQLQTRLENFFASCDSVKYSCVPDARDNALPLLEEARSIVKDDSDALAHG